MNRGISQDTVTGSAEPSRNGITSSSNKAKITSFIFSFEVTKRQIEKIESTRNLTVVSCSACCNICSVAACAKRDAVKFWFTVHIHSISLYNCHGSHDCLMIFGPTLPPGGQRTYKYIHHPALTKLVTPTRSTYIFLSVFKSLYVLVQIGEQSK